MDDNLKLEPDLTEAIITAVELYLEEEIYDELTTGISTSSFNIGSWQLAMLQPNKKAVPLIQNNSWKISERY